MMNLDLFIGHAESLLQKKIKNIKIICPDQFIGFYSKSNNGLKNGKRKDFPFRINTDEIPEDLPKIIIILESPHKYEYSVPIGPAKGLTGRNIREYLTDVFEQFNTYDVTKKHRVVLINAIQYQCSLGFKTSIFRNQMFNFCWDKFGKRNFISRLKKIYHDNDIIINSSTAGAGVIRIREKVKSAIEEAVEGKANPIEVEHPSNWLLRMMEVAGTDNAPDFSWRTEGNTPINDDEESQISEF